MSRTLKQLRQDLAYLNNLVLPITTSSVGTTTTFICDALSDTITEEDELTGRFAMIYPTSSTSAWRRITDYDTSTFTATVNRAYAALVGNSAEVDVFASFTPDEFKRALNIAREECYPYIAQKLVDESLTTGSGVNRFTYTVPSTIRDLSPLSGGKVSVQYNETYTSYPYMPITKWEVREANETRTLQLFQDVPVNRTLRLEGIGLLDELSDEDDTVPLFGDTIKLFLYKAAEVLWRSAPSLGNTDRGFYESQEQRFRGLYEQHKNQYGVLVESAYLVDPNNRSIATDLPIAANRTPSA